MATTLSSKKLLPINTFTEYRNLKNKYKKNMYSVQRKVPERKVTCQWRAVHHRVNSPCQGILQTIFQLSIQNYMLATEHVTSVYVNLLISLNPAAQLVQQSYALEPCYIIGMPPATQAYNITTTVCNGSSFIRKRLNAGLLQAQKAHSCVALLYLR